jgi:hypothetical protein
MLRYNSIELKSLFSKKSNAREFVGSYRIDSEDIVAIWDTPGSPALKAQLLANDVQAIARRTTDVLPVCLTNRLGCLIFRLRVGL